MVNGYFIEFFLLLVCLKTSTTGKQIVIAHRGASGYLPEHTLPGKAMAVAFGSDYIEQDIVMTKDSVLVVCHDVHLDTTTNVVDVYKGRNRTDGRYYVIDFTWDEIKDLKPKDMAEIAKYAQGVGPNKNMIIFPNSTSDNLQISDLVKNAHAEGLVVHPWTFRSDQGQVPPYAKEIYDLFKIFFRAAKVDGVFTDFPDKAVRFLSTSSGHRIEAVLCSIFIGISSSLLASFCSGAM